MPPKEREPRNSLRDRLRRVARDSDIEPRERVRRVARQRAKAVAEAWTERQAETPRVVVAGVPMGHVAEIDGGVEVWLGPQRGAPDFRIFNPPTLVTDPAGDISIEHRTERYREDPLAALAEAIQSARRTARKSRRR